MRSNIPESYQQVKLKVLFSQLKNIQKFLKSQYKKSVISTNRSETQKIIYNSYYIIDKKIKNMLCFDKNDIVTVDSILSTEIGTEILNACNDNNIPSTDDVLEILSLIKKRRYISNTEFELLEWEFSYSVISAFAEIFFNNEERNFSAMQLVTLLSKSDTLCNRIYVERLSPIELIYNNDPALIYKKMDEQTKQIYRHRTSFIAKKLKLNETDVAEKILSISKKSYENNMPLRETHVGFYIYRDYYKLKNTIKDENYFRLLFILPAVLSVILAYFTGFFFISFLFYFPLWEITKMFTDYFISKNKDITYLPRMNNNGKINEKSSTLCVISSVLSSTKEILSLKSKLQSLYFLCKTSNLKICILCDFLPSDTPKEPQDNALNKVLSKVISSLNAEFEDSFIGIIRERTFSKSEQKFIGADRKRGAIDALIGLIKENKKLKLKVFGDIDFLQKVKYIVALDYDTKPLMDTPSILVSIAEHPLNTPYEDSGNVTKGYGIIAPRITTELESSMKTNFSCLYGGMGSSCAYDVLCADLYQDNFHEGIFAGKGLIDVDCYYNLCYNKLPHDCILSHDILEGSILRTAFAGDVEFRDSYPSTAMSYFKRQHRWIRGDIQNSVFINPNTPLQKNQLKNNLKASARFKLFDNVRRSVTPIICFLLFNLCFFLIEKAFYIAFFTALVSLILPYIWGILGYLKANGYFSLTRKYYSAALSQTKALAIQMFYSLLLLPQNAIISFDAVTRAAYRRFISKKHLLEWTTAAQTDKKTSSSLKKFKYYFFAEIISILMIFSPYPLSRLAGIIFSAMPLLIIFSDKPYRNTKSIIADEKISALTADAAAMWQYYEDFCIEKYNYLPPDNVQFSPVFRICERTSPTNIGMYLLSILVARDFDFIDSKGLFSRIDRTISSIENLQKYDGNLYNWYDIKTLNLSPNPFVSSVDSANLICCLTALKEGLKDYRHECSSISSLILKIEKIIDNTDISIFYNDAKNLFAIGINPLNHTLTENNYDMLMSESRLLSYYTIAKRIVPKKHWRCLARTMKRTGNYYGSASYSGTMFEFFMPELLLKNSYGSLTYENLEFCIHCQLQKGKDKKLPTGISESAYYAFDNMLNYQYKAHGVQNIGIRRGLDSEYVVSPYSSYLAMQFSTSAFFNNLSELKKYGSYGPYGHYEAIDFTAKRGGCSVIKSYMAHHVGMSLIALDNTLSNSIMQIRFLRDNYMKSATELLDEKVLSGSIIYDDFLESQQKEESKVLTEEYFDNFSVSQPTVKLLANGDYTLCVSNLGATVSIYQGNDVTQRTTDLYRRPQGCYFAVKTAKGLQVLTYLPTYNAENLSCTFKEYSVDFSSVTEFFDIKMKLFLHNSLPCEFKEFTIKNKTLNQQKISLICYLEPIIMNYLEFEAHPAFMKLFIDISYDEENACVIVCRRERNKPDTNYAAIGFTDFSSFCYNFNREDILTFPRGTVSVFEKADEIPENPNHIPDPCVFIRKKITLLPKDQQVKTLFITTETSKEALYNNIAEIRKINHSVPDFSHVRSTSFEGQITERLLPQLLFKNHDSYENDAAINKNSLYLNELWALSISGDLPIISATILHENDEQRVIGYIKCHELLRLCRIETDLIFIYSENYQQNTKVYNMIKNLIKINTSDNPISKRGGIHLVNKAEISTEIITLINAVAIHIAPKAMVRLGVPAVVFKPCEILPVTPQHEIENGFKVTAEKAKISTSPSHPWCHVIANEKFGTLLSLISLGFTFAYNSRENKLTPWHNDPLTDNRGEMLIIKINNKFYDLCYGAETVFSHTKAEFFGKTDFFESLVTVSIDKFSCIKKISVKINLKDKKMPFTLCFYAEPVCGVSQIYSRLLFIKEGKNSVSFKNPGNFDVRGFMNIICDKDCIVSTNRENILSGKWEDTTKPFPQNTCAALLINSDNKKEIECNFYISFTQEIENSCLTFNSLNEMPSENEINISTPSDTLNTIFNGWLYPQTLFGRMYARTGFYQNSGAFGFRDQLQDSCCIVLKAPSVTRKHILKACTSQFPEGDVLHWWHEFPDGTKRGIRTRFSDDHLWLAYTLCEYLEKTNDYSILTERTCYCEGETLNENEKEKYITISYSKEKESVYNHAKKTILKSLKLSDKGLLFIGCGDWNDGYNTLGKKGLGESVWLTEFFCIILEKFSSVADKIGEVDFKTTCLTTRDLLFKNILATCWDGEWFIRAFFDDGTPLGSHENKECRIDSLSQSFAALSNLPDAEKVKKAVNTAYLRLADIDSEIIKLFEPPFFGKNRQVGYVATYPPGIRENGGQYTHGAIWLSAALLHIGENNKGAELIKILNPLEKYQNKVVAKRYKNEPYYLSADIYTNMQCLGRGGWSIYTGAAGWYYRVILEWLLGIKINRTLTISPAIPDDWDGFKISLNYKNTAISISVTRGNDCGMYDNDIKVPEISFDGKFHDVKVIIPNSRLD